MTPFRRKAKKGSDYYAVKLTDMKGKSKDVKVTKVIFETFGGKIPNGYCVYHKDGDIAENRFTNLILLTKEELAKRTGHMSKSRAVMKYTACLNPAGIDYKRGGPRIQIKSYGLLVATDVYRSAREAAKDNNMSYQTVIDRCNHKTKKSLFAPDGHVYLWDDEHEYQAA
jgi:hypothetical protein